MKSFLKEIIYGIIVITLIYVIGMIFGETIWQIIVTTPELNSIYLLIMKEVATRSVIGLSVMTFAGSLFFVAYPAELLFFLYTRVGYNVIYVTLIMIFYTMVAQVLNYGMGYYIEKKILIRFVKSKKIQYLSHLRKLDLYFITVLNILPLPADILSVLLGMIRYDFKKAMLYTFLGKLIKYLFLILLLILTTHFSI